MVRVDRGMCTLPMPHAGRLLAAGTMLSLAHGPPGSRVGLWLAILAAFFNGSFGVFSKLRSTRNEHPLIFNYWLGEGVALSGLLLLAVPPRVGAPGRVVRLSLMEGLPLDHSDRSCVQHLMRASHPSLPRCQAFSAYGMLSGVLFVLSASNAVTAISLIGLAAATGVWCGVAVLTSFAWGVLVVGDEVEHMWQAAAALALILLGISGIAASAANGGQAEASPSVSREASNEPEAAGSGTEGGPSSGYRHVGWLRPAVDSCV